MRFLRSGSGTPASVGILAGSFNPPTVAHGELIYAAGYHVDEVLCVLPSVFPHKEYFGATLEQRIEMLHSAYQILPYSIAVSEGGLFIEIARKCRQHFGLTVRLYFLCGADAAERIMNWDYGRPEFADEMLKEFELLVAPRGGRYEPPQEHRDKIHELHIGGTYHDVSSTEVRERIRRGEPWEHLVPEAIRDQVRAIY